MIAIWTGKRRKHREYAAQLHQLLRSAAKPGPDSQAGPRSLEQLPDPVRRYLRWALHSTRQIRVVRMRQVGRLRTDVRSNRWMSFDAHHLVVPPATAFMWDARVAVAPFLHLRVKDGLSEGRGSGQVSVLSAFTIAADSGTPEMNAGSLHRFLAEAVWYPTVLLPGAKLRWTGIDHCSAVATLTDCGVSVSLEFRFAETGEVTSVFTPARWGRFQGSYKQVPWEGHFRNYQKRACIMVPAEGEVGWYFENNWRAVWEGQIVTFQIDNPIVEIDGTERESSSLL